MVRRESDIARVGKVLLIIGAIISVITSVLILVMLSLMAFIAANTASASLVIVFIILISILVAGSVLAIVAVFKASNHQFKSAGVLGIIASLLPPVQVLVLVGAILCLVSPEAKK